MQQYQATQLITISSCIDDLSPEIYPYVLERLIELGVNDAWIVPIIMKKGRPGIKLEVLCTAEKKQKVLTLIFQETSSIGVRVSQVERVELKRSEVCVSVDGADIRVKLAYLPDGSISNIKPELEDCRKVAINLGLPLSEVCARALKCAAEKI